jgi:glycosyltransferase involved in cell wall biosynthesis
MGTFYTILALTFIFIFFVNVVWIGFNSYLWIMGGIQALLEGMNVTEKIFASTYLKWILVIDILWICTFLIFLIRKKSHDINLQYLIYKPITNPKICVVIPAYNEEEGIELIVNDFSKQKYVKQVMIIDNHSTDNTVEIAKKAGAVIITKNKNQGYAHSWFLGLKKSLETSANVIVIVDADNTFNAYDIKKMLPYLDNCDMVIGSRIIHPLTEKNNQNTLFYVWGNFFIAKLLEIKYFRLGRAGAFQMTDVGCSYRCMRKESLEKIIENFTYKNSDKLLPFASGNNPGIVTTSVAIENNQRVIEIPITFKKRIGISKSGANKKSRGFRYGLEFIWQIIRY